MPSCHEDDPRSSSRSIDSDPDIGPARRDGESPTFVSVGFHTALPVLPLPLPAPTATQPARPRDALGRRMGNHRYPSSYDVPWQHHFRHCLPCTPWSWRRSQSQLVRASHPHASTCTQRAPDTTHNGLTTSGHVRPRVVQASRDPVPFRLLVEWDGSTQGQYNPELSPSGATRWELLTVQYRANYLDTQICARSTAGIATVDHPDWYKLRIVGRPGASCYGQSATSLQRARPPAPSQTE